MTRRERLERKLEKRREWAESAGRKVDAYSNKARHCLDGIEPGQPILVGHHSEKRHRGALDRHDRNMNHVIENMNKAKDHTSKAGGLADQLDRSIFSDDPDAIEALTARADELDAEADLEVATNKAWRKHKGTEGWADGLGLTPERIARHNRTMALSPYLKGPCFSTNTRANARRLRQRIAEITRRRRLEAEAEAAGGVLITERPAHDWYPAYCSVRFAEKPEYSIIQELKAAGFSWGSGAWCGDPARVPESVRRLAERG